MIRRPPRSPLFPSPPLFRSIVTGASCTPIDADGVTMDLPPEQVEGLARLTFGVDDKALGVGIMSEVLDRKSTRLNSSHANISYAVFCLKKTNPRPPAPSSTS